MEISFECEEEEEGDRAALTHAPRGCKKPAAIRKEAAGRA